jgi:hypothetical protein
MKIGLRALLGSRVAARDGDAGKIHGFRFLASCWRVERLLLDGPEFRSEGCPLVPMPAIVRIETARPIRVRLHLSMKQIAAEIEGWKLRCGEGAFGSVDDLVIDIGVWRVRHLMLAAHRWLPGPTHLVPIEYIDAVDPSERHFRCRAPREQVLTSPAVDPWSQVDGEVERSVMEHYLGGARRALVRKTA